MLRILCTYLGQSVVLEISSICSEFCWTAVTSKSDSYIQRKVSTITNTTDICSCTHYTYVYTDSQTLHVHIGSGVATVGPIGVLAPPSII